MRRFVKEYVTYMKERFVVKLEDVHRPESTWSVESAADGFRRCVDYYVRCCERGNFTEEETIKLINRKSDQLIDFAWERV